jgi:hypothetical protein
MKSRKLTPEIDVLLSAEAMRRASGMPLVQRTRTKELAAETGLAYSYVANIIARKRRELEEKVDVSCETVPVTNAS